MRVITASVSRSARTLASGVVQCWGYNGYHQLGNQTEGYSATPIPLPGITNAIGVAAGALHLCVLLATGSIECLGDNGWDELGEPPTFDTQGNPLPSYVPLLVDECAAGQTSCSEGYALSCASDYQWGDATACPAGQVCDGPACAAGCSIGGAYYAPGAVNPGDSCQSCQPTVRTWGWSEITCSFGQVCSGGSCTAGCSINGAFVAPGTVDPDNQCLSCDPNVTTTQYSGDAYGCCVGDTVVLPIQGTTTNCAPYTCEMTTSSADPYSTTPACSTTCSTAADCAAGSACEPVVGNGGVETFCTTCGVPGGPICPTGPKCNPDCNAPGSCIDDGVYCIPCGAGTNQYCCPDSAGANTICYANFTCNGDGWCQCGNLGEACCGGTTCNSGLSCSSGTCQCSGSSCACGDANQQCCNSGGGCYDGLKCYFGYGSNDNSSICYY